MRLRTMEGSEESTSQSNPPRRSAHRIGPEPEAIHIRNYDHGRSYELEIEVEIGDGEGLFQRRYQLRPGQIVSEDDVLPGGTCIVSVTMDDTSTRALECRIDESPENTATIEVGNGALSLVEGLTGGRRRPSRREEPRERAISSMSYM